MVVFRFSSSATPQEVGVALHSLLADIIRSISPESIYVSRTLRRLGLEAPLISKEFSDAVYVLTCSWNVLVFRSRNEYRAALLSAFDEFKSVHSCAEWFRRSDRPYAIKELVCGPYRSKDGAPGWVEVGYVAALTPLDALLRFKRTAAVVDFRATTKRRLSSSYFASLYIWYNLIASLEEGRTTPELWTASLRHLSGSVYVETAETEEELREGVNSVYELIRKRAERCGSTWAVDRFFKSLRVVTISQLLRRFNKPTEYVCEHGRCIPK